MVLGISLRGKKKKEEPTIRPSPSLPSVLPTGIPWPEDLVDINDVKAARTSTQQSEQQQQRDAQGTLNRKSSINFARPFRTGSPSSESGPIGGKIASLFSSKGAGTGGFIRSSGHPTVSLSRSQRRRVAPTLNIVVAGERSTGKTSLLKLFLETSEISSTATPEQKLSVDTFMSKSRKSTRSLQTVCVEIAETRFDRILLTLVDTPGLCYADGQELALERSVSSLVKYIDMQYDETMGEESKVVRQSKGDQHVHLCIYLIDPDSIMTVKARRAKSRLPTRTRSQIHLASRDDATNESSDEEEEDEYDNGQHHHSKLCMNPAEIRVIKRLASRVNVLPVIARSDSLTESRLRAVKRTVRRELIAAGVGFGVFSPSTVGANVSNGAAGQGDAASEAETPTKATGVTTAGDAEGEEEDAEEDRQARPVIRIRARKSFTGTERSRSRRRRSGLDEPSPERGDEDGEQPPLPDGSSAITATGSRLSKAALEAILPFAFVSPQPQRKGEMSPGTQSPVPNGNHLSANELDVPATPLSQRSSVPPSAFPQQYQSPGINDYETREFPKGRFVRNFKWGTLDVLDPAHCDFVALRTAVLSTHFRAIKMNTREVLYEKYRTDKLLARRATRNITKEDRKRLLEDLGL